MQRPTIAMRSTATWRIDEANPALFSVVDYHSQLFVGILVSCMGMCVGMDCGFELSLLQC